MPLNHTSRLADLTDQQYQLLGKIVVEWSNIEFLLGVLLSRLLRTPEYLGRTYADGMSAVRLQSAISEAISVHRHRYFNKRIIPDLLDRAENINQRVSALRADRNRISHYCWIRSNDDEIFGTALAGGVPSPKPIQKYEKLFKLSELTQLHVAAYQITEELMELTQQIPNIPE